MRCIAVEPGNQWFVTGSADRTIKVRDIEENPRTRNVYLVVLYYTFYWFLLMSKILSGAKTKVSISTKTVGFSAFK